MSSIHLLKRFDPAQLFRLFVDGRFQKKYAGWVGYEAREPGSVKAILNGLEFVLDNFDITSGLHSVYLRELHKTCMSGVQTQNPKSAPGDLRYLNSGMPFLATTTTLENIREILELRRGDGTAVFNTAAFAKRAEDLDADEVHAAIRQLGRLNYRNWYPNLQDDAKAALAQKRSLLDFYEAKHEVQRQFASKVDQIVAQFNHDIARAENPDDRLRAIALLVRHLELLHPFADGNCRTFACVLLTQLLLNYEFRPTLLENPNLDGELSLEQWIGEIKKGMSLFDVLMQDSGASVYDLAIEDTTAESRTQFKSMSEAVVAKLAAHREIFLTADGLTQYTQGRWLQPCSPFLRFRGIGTHKTVKAGDLYFVVDVAALEEQGQDVRKSLAGIVARGVRALVIDREDYADGWSVPVYLVPNGLTALKEVAHNIRRDLDPLTILVTGTEGKTGAKIQLHHLLAEQARTHAVLNSANTEIPVLRSLANLAIDDQVEINEVSVGADEALRVERARIVNPNICLFTNIGPNHMDMHKTMDNVLRAKSSVVEGLAPGGLCILDSSNAWFQGLRSAIIERRPSTRILEYGFGDQDAAQLFAAEFDQERLGWNVHARIEEVVMDYFLPLVQQHAPLTSLGVLLTVKTAGYDVQRAASRYSSLNAFSTMGQVSRVVKDGGEFIFYDQSRRGGISGMRSAFADLQQIRSRGRLVALVGGISVLRDSDWTRDAHHQLAGLINASQIDRLYTTGNYIEYVHEHLEKSPVKTSNDLEELAVLLANDVQPGDTLFIIGSAYLYLGRVSDRVKELIAKGPGAKRPLLAEHPRAEEFRLLKVFADVESGVGNATACASNGVRISEYRSAAARHKDFTSFRGWLLEDFFRRLDGILAEIRPLQCVNEEIADSEWSGRVITRDFCRRWFNNLDKKPTIRSKQLFGSFYDFGDPETLLHIEAATANLHIGLVHAPLVGGQRKPQGTDAAGGARLVARFPAISALGAQHRSWGRGWVTVDLGRFIDVHKPEGFLQMVDFRNTALFRTRVRPFVEALDPANA